MKKTVFLIAILIALFACSTQKQVIVNNQTKIEKPRNIVFLIGDGMGLSQITAGLYTNNNKLNFERMPVVGLHKSYSGNDLITDSAAGATAFSCGCKSYNGAIGVKMDSTPCKTILEALQATGMTTGLLVTCTITHATPACYYAHQPSRSLDENIAKDLVNSGIDLFIGGGTKFFSQRKTDKRNLIDELKAKSYQIEESYKDEFLNKTWPVEKKLGFFTADDQPKTVKEGRDYEPGATVKSLDYLSKRAKNNGFFFMIEGSQIDWGGHEGSSEYIISETLDFDKVLGNVLDFAQKDGHTLVIVTADHETGGYAVLKGSKMGNIKGGFADPGKPGNPNYHEHTASLIPVFAYGPGSENFKGIYENTALYDKLMKLMFTNH